MLAKRRKLISGVISHSDRMWSSTLNSWPSGCCGSPERVGRDDVIAGPIAALLKARFVEL